MPLARGQSHAHFLRSTQDTLTDRPDAGGGAGIAALGTANSRQGFIQGYQVGLVGHGYETIQGFIRGAGDEGLLFWSVRHGVSLLLALTETAGLMVQPYQRCLNDPLIQGLPDMRRYQARQALKRIGVEKSLTLLRYPESMTTISNTALDGLAQAAQRFAKAAETIATAPATGADDTRALVEAKLSALDYRANAAVLKLDGERQQSLLDILA